MKALRILLLVIAIGMLNTLTAHAQDTTALDTSKILGDWVPKDFYYQHDTLEFIPDNSPLASNLALALKYNGISFEENGVFVQHHWRKCGNDDSPPSRKGTWAITTDKDKLTLITVDSRKNVRQYYIYAISADKLILVNKSIQ